MFSQFCSRILGCEGRYGFQGNEEDVLQAPSAKYENTFKELETQNTIKTEAAEQSEERLT